MAEKWKIQIETAGWLESVVTLWSLPSLSAPPTNKRKLNTEITQETAKKKKKTEPSKTRIFTMSGLSSALRKKCSEHISQLGATVEDQISPQTTHVICQQ